MLLSHYQAKQIFECKESVLQVSLDLGRSLSYVTIKSKKIYFPDGQTINLSDLNEIIKKDKNCFLIQDNTIHKVAIFSQETNKFYKLLPSHLDKPPTIEISGIRMHVTKKMSPLEDTKLKLSYVYPCKGNILDTCTGLGYTAIEASKTADHVWTYEIDPNVVIIQSLNPWSQELFNNVKISREMGDIYYKIQGMKSRFFSVIIHDPPRFSLSSELYSQEFYDHLYRVGARGCKLFHYTGDPGSKRGLDIRHGIIKRLKKSGFVSINRVYNGVNAIIS